jgi:hypothetical protein
MEAQRVRAFLRLLGGLVVLMSGEESYYIDHGY